jgi:hypothetical protein
MSGFVQDDGGRASAGFKPKKAGDCATRAIAIATGRPYGEVHKALDALIVAHEPRKGWPLKRGKKPTAETRMPKAISKRYLRSLGWVWVPTMGIGTGCRVHLQVDELPKGRIIVQTSHHLVAVIDGVIHDTHDPSRDGSRCVYGYWVAPIAQ